MKIFPLLLCVLLAGCTEAADTERMALDRFPALNPMKVDARKCVTEYVSNSNMRFSACSDGKALVICTDDQGCLVVELHPPATCPEVPAAP